MSPTAPTQRDLGNNATSKERLIAANIVMVLPQGFLGGQMPRYALQRVGNGSRVAWVSGPVWSRRAFRGVWRVRRLIKMAIKVRTWKEKLQGQGDGHTGVEYRQCEKLRSRGLLIRDLDARIPRSVRSSKRRTREQAFCRFQKLDA